MPRTLRLLLVVSLMSGLALIPSSAEADTVLTSCSVTTQLGRVHKSPYTTFHPGCRLDFWVPESGLVDATVTSSTTFVGNAGFVVLGDYGGTYEASEGRWNVLAPVKTPKPRYVWLPAGPARLYVYAGPTQYIGPFERCMPEWVNIELCWPAPSQHKWYELSQEPSR